MSHIHDKGLLSVKPGKRSKLGEYIHFIYRSYGHVWQYKLFQSEDLLASQVPPPPPHFMMLPIHFKDVELENLKDLEEEHDKQLKMRHLRKTMKE